MLMRQWALLVLVPGLALSHPHQLPSSAMIAAVLPGECGFQAVLEGQDTCATRQDCRWLRGCRRHMVFRAAPHFVMIFVGIDVPPSLSFHHTHRHHRAAGYVEFNNGNRK